MAELDTTEMPERGKTVRMQIELFREHFDLLVTQAAEHYRDPRQHAAWLVAMTVSASAVQDDEDDDDTPTPAELAQFAQLPSYVTKIKD